MRSEERHAGGGTVELVVWLVGGVVVAFLGTLALLFVLRRLLPTRV